MNFSIHSHGFPLTTALENHVRRRLHYVLTRHGKSIDSIVIDLRSGFGAASGFESSCSIRAELIDRALPAITEHGTDIYIVCDRGVDQIGRLITQMLNRGHAGPVALGLRQSHESPQSRTALAPPRPAPTGRSCASR